MKKVEYSKLTKDEIINCISNNSLYIYDFDLFNKWRDDKNVILELVKKNGMALQFVSERLKNDPIIVRSAIKQTPYALQYSSKNLKDNTEIVLETVKINGFALKCASDRLQNDKQLLELLENFIFETKNCYGDRMLNWCNERMEVLANIREKELIENSIITHNNSINKIKF